MKNTRISFSSQSLVQQKPFHAGVILPPCITLSFTKHTQPFPLMCPQTAANKEQTNIEQTNGRCTYISEVQCSSASENEAGMWGWILANKPACHTGTNTTWATLRHTAKEKGSVAWLSRAPARILHSTFQM